MAKSKGAFLSLETNGSIGSVLTARRGKKTGVLTYYGYPGSVKSFTPSAAQIAQRAAFGEAKDAWNALDTDQKAVYTARAWPMKITGYNLFIREYDGYTMKSKKITLTAAQILDIDSTPVEILPAPGMGKTYLSFFLYTNYRYGTVPYTADDGLYFAYGSMSSPQQLSIMQSGALTLTENAGTINGWIPTGNGSGAAASTLENLPVIIGGLTSNIAGGDGEVDITIFYDIVDI